MAGKPFDFYTSPIDFPNLPQAARCQCGHGQSWHRPVTGSPGGYCRWCGCTDFAHIAPPPPSHPLQPDRVGTPSWPSGIVFAVGLPVVVFVVSVLILMRVVS